MAVVAASTAASPRRRWLRLPEWPLPPSLVNRYAPAAAAALLAPVAVIVWRYNLRRPTKAEVDWQDEELARKREKLATVIHQARGFLAALEQERRRFQEEHEAKGSGGGEGGEEGAAGAEEAAMSGIDRFLIKLVGGKRKDEEFKIRFVDIWQTCREVQALCRNHELLAPGMDVAAQILSMELTRASLRTLGGKDPQFSNGEKLKERLQLAKWYRQTCQRLRPDFAREQRAIIDAHCTELLRKYVAGHAILGKQKKWDVFFALQMVLTAKREVLVLFVASFMSATKGALDALDVLYMSDAVEMLRTPTFKWGGFIAQLRAFVSVRLLKVGLQLLIDRVSSLGRQQMEHRLRTELYRSLLHQDFEWYRLGQTDERDMRSIFGSVFALPQHVTGFTSTFTQMIERSASAASQLAILVSKSSALFKAMVVLECAGIMVRKGIVYCIDYAKWDLDRRQVTVDVQWHEPLAPDNLPTTRAFTAEDRTLTNWEMFWGSTMRKESLKQVIDALAAPFLAMADNITPIGSTARAAQLIKRGEVNMADFEAIKAMSSGVVWHVRTLIGTWSTAKDNYEPLARSWEIISLEPTIGLGGGLEPPDRAVGALTFEGVEFKYEEGPKVIQGVSFHAGAGTKCAITGTSGSGKTTVFKLLERFYDPQVGRILLDGRDIRDLNPVWLRRQISIVDQRPRILSLPLRDNLIYGCKDDPTPQQIEDACRAAGIYDFVYHNKEKFPAGLYTRVSPHTLSGGELQRVAIARAVLKDAPVLLLDEATSALDSHTQTAVKGAISRLMEGRTTVMIAHRLETIREADQIMVMSKGEVVERGSHEELVAKEGHYAELYAQQVTETMVGGASPPAKRG